MNIILLGSPGAGKGTQATELEAATGMKHIASGDMFRAAVREGTPLGKLAQSYLDKGELVPDDVVIGMVLERVRQPDCENGVIFDGFPRTPQQAEALQAALAEHNDAINAVLLLHVDKDVLIQRVIGRWTCRKCQAVYNTYFRAPKVEGVCDLCEGDLYQRSDDNLETINHRLDVYEAQTSPLIAHYRTQGILHEIDGLGDIDDITARMVQAIESAKPC
ncbi:MAG TPA: adenylate kinase [Herpetosiphon sp.]|jgi:adenylate kinase|uniref:Adenylate kinase n=1 Tax=Herpetosiphon aurantiacus (strain ATCC 23779 / DSM 785 / 114-95) TaxID=316274 RepID=A9B432_HERA2|nr:adenylate kinase [Herpetosiphon sp.]ABX07565.1 Nucleoside-triphosphate--adenylate kinase [Herpetosiphon aurantiacus DSM 785]MCA0353149.1 adenylate kinase [Chloroflexota bacterium]HBW49660.1 adenylate kinase [Herpetosiphon sp.]